eukprot:jgi/Astpho2/2728/Aster-x0126
MSAAPVHRARRNFAGDCSAAYFDAPGRPSIAWTYKDPSRNFKPIKDHLAFYAGKLDQATVDGEVVKMQPGDFYGGWQYSKVVGPFKGDPGTWGW